MARAVATDGIAAYKEKRYEEAIELLARAESLVHAPAHLLYTARAHSALGQLVKAREVYLRLAHEKLPASASAAFVEAQATARAELQAIEARIARIKVTVEGAPANSVNVTMDGKPFLSQAIGVMTPIDPGEHRFVADGTKLRSEEVLVKLADGERKTVVLKVEASTEPGQPEPAAAPAPAKSEPAAPTPQKQDDVGARGATQLDSGTADRSDAAWMRPAAIAAFVVGGLGLGTGIFFSLRTQSKDKEADELADACGASCPTSDPRASRITELDAESRSAKTWAIVGFVGAGVGVAAGTALWLLAPSSGKATAAAPAGVRVSSSAGSDHLFVSASADW